jgi:hypothetical protein
MKTAKRKANGCMSCHMSSEGSGLSRPKPQDKRLSSLYMDRKLFYRPISCGSLQGSKCTTKARQLELDSIEEARCTALVQSVRYLQGIRRYHDRNMRERSLSIGDLVLRCIQDESGIHKLNSRWEGPFVVKQVTRPGSYRLQSPEGQDVPNSWNIQNLRKFYP